MPSYLPSMMRICACVAASLAAPFLFGADAGRTEVQAQLLDHAEFLCANCLFAASNYYYCFAAENQVLIGYQKTPVMNFEDKSQNYLAGVHRNWAAWTPPGQTVPIRYDDKHIWVRRGDSRPENQGFRTHVKAIASWVSRGNGKQVRLTRSSKRDIFTNDDRCRVVDGAKAR